MKAFISLMILMIGLLITLPPGNQVQASILPDQSYLVVEKPDLAPVILSQEEGGVDPAGSLTVDVDLEPAIEKADTGNFFLNNWVALLMGLLGSFDLIARLTPTEKDNSIVNFLFSLFSSLIPNLKKGGGSFKLLSK